MIDIDVGQLDAINSLKVGNILAGKVGSGKTRTSLAYFFTKILDGEFQMRLMDFTEEIGIFGEDVPPTKDISLYVITTAKKRDSMDWELEASDFGIFNITVDSWNNIKKYKDVQNAFFIFDEQRLVGRGAWAKAFLKIAKGNQWILLSATPGDKWEDYATIFIANGFYKGYSQFEADHVVFQPYVTYRNVIGYRGERQLRYYRDKILVNIVVKGLIIRHEEYLDADYDKELYRVACRRRRNPYTNARIENAADLCMILRKVMNSDISREALVKHVCRKHPKLIIFYNFNFELEILRNIIYPKGTKIAEWNGHKHEPIPDSERWVYLVHYVSGAEGWNCIETNAILFYSQTYSYKNLEQAEGRIDRRNTPYSDLYYYHIVCKAPLEIAISRALKQKQLFNASSYMRMLKK